MEMKFVRLVYFKMKMKNNNKTIHVETTKNRMIFFSYSLTTHIGNRVSGIIIIRDLYRCTDTRNASINS